MQDWVRRRGCCCACDLCCPSCVAAQVVGAPTLFATHFAELTELEACTSGEGEGGGPQGHLMEENRHWLRQNTGATLKEGTGRGQGTRGNYSPYTVVPVCEGERINNLGLAFGLTFGLTIKLTVRFMNFSPYSQSPHAN